MLARLHRRYDAMPERRRDAILAGLISLLFAALFQTWSQKLVGAALLVIAVLVGSRLQHLEGR